MILYVFFLDCIEGALRKRGINTYRINEFTDEVLNQQYDAMVAVNSSYVSVKLPNGSYLMDFFHCLFFNILLDPPYYHHKLLDNHMEDLHIICLDREHVEYCKRYYSPFKSVNQGYVLGPVGKIIPYEEREIELLFTGTCSNETEILKQAKKFY